MIKLSNVFYVVLIVILMACNNDSVEPTIEINNPSTYEFLRDGESTVSFSGQTTRIGMATELVNAMKKFDISEELLLEMFANQSNAGEDVDPFSDPVLNSSTKSVKSKVAASADFFSANTSESAEIKADFETWIKAQVQEVFPSSMQLAMKGVAGQIADDATVRYVSAKGLEYNQAVNKGLIGALMVDQMLNNYLSPTVLDDGDNRAENDLETIAEGEVYTNMEHKWDEAYGYLFGAEGTNFAQPLETLGDDSFLNKYLSRVEEDPDFSGIASTVYEALKLGRAAIVAKDYATRDEQAAIVRERISTVIGIRAVYYLQQGKLAIANGDWGAGFHDLSEGFGFVYSLRFTRKADSNEPYFTQNEVDGFMDRLTAGDGFWDISAESLDQMSNDIASKFNFTVEQAGS